MMFICSYLLGLLANEGYLIISVPYNVTFDHSKAATEVYDKFHLCLDSILTSGLPNDDVSSTQLVDLPLYSVGHSNGALLQPKNVMKLSNQYFENVAMKINVKVGGRNSVLAAALANRLPYITERPTIIFGADVTHPSPGEDSSPSIAAVVASMDWPQVTKYKALVSAQPHRQEIIEDLYSTTTDARRGVIHTGLIRELLRGVIRGSGRGVVKSDTTYVGSGSGSNNVASTTTIMEVNNSCAVPFRTDASALGSYTPPAATVSGRRRFSEAPVHGHGHVQSAMSDGDSGMKRESLVIQKETALAHIYRGSNAVTQTLLNFVRLFRKAHEENYKHAKLDKKKAQKEVEMERAKEHMDTCTEMTGELQGEALMNKTYATRLI
uniref:Piwi domain-containing protein n=1 Tax=Lactuca sativa TaxID=4236 RepID=A0A9R1V6X5_LACSA|nr:hypothetical protein LSAT_V11C600320530 [Lactuca sativa]